MFLGPPWKTPLSPLLIESLLALQQMLVQIKQRLDALIKTIKVIINDIQILPIFSVLPVLRDLIEMIKHHQVVYVVGLLDPPDIYILIIALMEIQIAPTALFIGEFDEVGHGLRRLIRLGHVLELRGEGDANLIRVLLVEVFDVLEALVEFIEFVGA
jgi:hypothetical protein